MRIRLIAGVAGLVVLAGCSSSPTAPSANEVAPARACGVADIDAAKKLPYPDTNSGWFIITNGLLMLTAKDGKARSMSVRADRLFHATEAMGESIALYSTPVVGGESELRSITASGKSVSLGAASAPEWQVTSAFFDIRKSEWLITGISDLSEVVVRRSAVTGEIVGFELAPYEYNKEPFIEFALPQSNGTRYVLVSSRPGSTGSDREWFLSRMAPSGSIVGVETPWPAKYGVPVSGRVRNSVPVVVTTDGSLYQITTKTESLQISPYCG